MPKMAFLTRFATLLETANTLGHSCQPPSNQFQRIQRITGTYWYSNNHPNIIYFIWKMSLYFFVFSIILPFFYPPLLLSTSWFTRTFFRSLTHQDMIAHGQSLSVNLRRLHFTLIYPKAHINTYKLNMLSLERLALGVSLLVTGIQAQEEASSSAKSSSTHTATALDGPQTHEIKVGLVCICLFLLANSICYKV